MTALFVVAGIVQLGLLIFFFVAGAWAYRQFRLPSIPWLLSYLLLASVVGLPTSHAAKRVVDQAAASGLGPIGSSISLGEFIASVSVISSALAAIGQALIAWFIVAELAFAYQRLAPTEAIPAIVAVPRQHSSIIGFALLFCAAAMPLFWLVLLVTQT